MIPMEQNIIRQEEDNIVRLRAAYPDGLHFVVGDTHGETAPLRTLTEQIAFDPQKDHVYFVGDYNYGGDVSRLLRYLALYYEPDLSKPGFHLIRGNHEREEYPIYELKNLPDIIVLRGKQMNYYIVHAGMVTAGFDAINADMEANPGQPAYAYRIEDTCAYRGGALREIVWSRGGLYSPYSRGKRWPTFRSLTEHRACILHGHTPYCFFLGNEPGYGVDPLFWQRAHIWFDEDLQSFDLDSNIKGRFKNGETYRGLACLCLEVCEEAAKQSGGILMAESIRSAQNMVFSTPFAYSADSGELGDLNRILQAEPEMKTLGCDSFGTIAVLP